MACEYVSTANSNADLRGRAREEESEREREGEEGAGERGGIASAVKGHVRRPTTDRTCQLPSCPGPCPATSRLFVVVVVVVVVFCFFLLSVRRPPDLQTATAGAEPWGGAIRAWLVSIYRPRIQTRIFGIVRERKRAREIARERKRPTWKASAFLRKLSTIQNHTSMTYKTKDHQRQHQEE